MKILITGGAGFIGAHVAKALHTAGHVVFIYDDFNNYLYPSELKEARVTHLLGDVPPEQILRGDILDSTLLTETCTREHFDVILHFAAYANPGRSHEAEETYTAVNVLGTLHVLQAATAGGAKRLIFAGSSSVYNDTHTPFTEDSYPLLPHSVYGASKAAAELYCTMWHDLHQLPITILRFFSVYGPWGRPDMAPLIFASRIMAGEPIELTQEDRERDFTYIDDVVAGIVAALNLETPFEIINIGRGEPRPVRELVTALEQAAGKTAVITPRLAPPGEMRVTYADVSKAKRLLNYEPKVSLQAGAVALVEWLTTWQANVKLF